MILTFRSLLTGLINDEPNTAKSFISVGSEVGGYKESVSIPPYLLTHHHQYLPQREMGNCQAIDNASLVIQQPSGRVDKMYTGVPASDIMKTNPGYYVALLLTTTLYPPSSNNQPLRITRIKLLRPTDNLLLGHTYRLLSSQGMYVCMYLPILHLCHHLRCWYSFLFLRFAEVMKGLWAKKYAKKQNKQAPASGEEVISSSSEFDNFAAAAAAKQVKLLGI